MEYYGNGCVTLLEVVILVGLLPPQVRISGNFVHEEILNSVIHGTGLALSLLGAVPMLSRGADMGERSEMLHGVICDLANLYLFGSVVRKQFRVVVCACFFCRIQAPVGPSSPTWRASSCSLRQPPSITACSSLTSATYSASSTTRRWVVGVLGRKHSGATIVREFPAARFCRMSNEIRCFDLLYVFAGVRADCGHVLPLSQPQPKGRSSGLPPVSQHVSPCSTDGELYTLITCCRLHPSTCFILLL